MIEINSLFNNISNEHTVFAGTLRDWCDPLLQGQERIPVPLCPRCVTCRCESLKDLPDSPSNSSHNPHREYRYHDPSCPNHHHQHERTKSACKRQIFTKPKRRAISHDPSIAFDSHKSLRNQNVECSPSPSSTPTIQRRQKISKIPVRVSTPSSVMTTPTTTTTTASEYSPSSLNSSRSSNARTKIPRPISKRNMLRVPQLTFSSPSSSSTDEDSNDNDSDR